MDFQAVINAVLNKGTVESELQALLQDRKVYITPEIQQGSSSLSSTAKKNIDKTAKVTSAYYQSAMQKVNRSAKYSQYPDATYTTIARADQQQRKAVAKAIKKNTGSTYNEANAIISQYRSDLSKQQKELERTIKSAEQIEKKYSSNTYSSQLSKQQQKFSTFSKRDTDEYKSAASSMKALESSYDSLTKSIQTFQSHRTDANFQSMTKAVDQFNQALNTTKNNFSTLSAQGGVASSEKQIASLSKKVQTYVQNNPRAYKKMQTEFDTLAKQLDTTDLSRSETSNLETQFTRLQSSAVKQGLEGTSLLGELKRGAAQIGQFVLTYGLLQQGVDKIADSINEIKEIDTILTEISKTSDSTESELRALGKSSFSSASKYGRTATDYLLGVQEMNRSGYYGEQGTAMAELSILAQSAGDLDADMANSYLLATDAAYKYHGSVEKLNAVLDGQNAINIGRVI